MFETNYSRVISYVARYICVHLKAYSKSISGDMNHRLKLHTTGIVKMVKYVPIYQLTYNNQYAMDDHIFLFWSEEDCIKNKSHCIPVLY
jgi:hypothetical protein